MAAKKKKATIQKKTAKKAPAKKAAPAKRTAPAKKAAPAKKVGRITGIGGVFLRANHDTKALSAWYQQHLGLECEEWGGAILRWPEDRAEDRGATVWHLASPESTWFAPSTGDFMINYRVDDMDAIMRRLKDGGVPIYKGPEYAENGAFLWVVDPDGNKVELWEPKIWNDKNKR